MNKLCVALVLLFALPGWAGPVKPHKAVTKTSAKAPAKTKHIEHKVSKATKKPLCKTLKAASQPTPTAVTVNEIAKPAADDPDRNASCTCKQPWMPSCTAKFSATCVWA